MNRINQKKKRALVASQAIIPIFIARSLSTVLPIIVKARDMIKRPATAQNRIPRILFISCLPAPQLLGLWHPAATSLKTSFAWPGNRFPDSFSENYIATFSCLY